MKLSNVHLLFNPKKLSIPDPFSILWFNPSKRKKTEKIPGRATKLESATFFFIYLASVCMKHTIQILTGGVALVFDCFDCQN